jgi:hypothetical protein
MNILMDITVRVMNTVRAMVEKAWEKEWVEEKVV